MAASLTPTIIVMALGAGALGFPDALRLLLRDVAERSHLDLAICAFAMAVLTAYALGAVQLARFVRKAGAGAGRAQRAQLTDAFARLTLAVSLGASALVLACLLLPDGLASLCRRILDVVVGESQSPVIMAVSVLVATASAAAVLACTTRLRALLRAAPASRLSVTAQPASYKGHGRGSHTSGTAPRESVGTSMAAEEALIPKIIVLALGAVALGFPDALRLLRRDVAGRRSPVLDIAVCAVAMATLTAYALGAVLLVRKAGPGAGAGGNAPRARFTDPFARFTLAVALGASVVVLACLIAAPSREANGAEH